MGLARTSRLSVVPDVQLESLPLGPQEYFVFSRIEGRPTVGEVIDASGLGAGAAEIIERLIELGAVKAEDGPPSQPSRRRKSTQELRAQASERRRRMLAQQMGASRRTESPPRRPESKPPAAAPSVEPEAFEQGPVVAPVPPDDPRIDDALGLSAEQQRHLLALEDRLGQLTPFELLGLRPTHDLKAIRTAFRESSRTFHPDAYHGRELGRYRELLSTLFLEAKNAVEALQRDEVRNPLVAVVEAEIEERRRREAQREAARKAADELRNRREQEAAAKRRAVRAAQQAERKRERLNEAVKSKVAGYVQAATKAEEANNFASAANNYRLALQLDPNDAQLKTHWDRVRGIAKQRRAKDAFTQACHYVEIGHFYESVSLFLEAAEADPSIEHLAHAADAVREQDPGLARDLAIEALRLLAEDEASPTPRKPATVADLRLMIGRAFLAAGQAQSAREQARLVQKLRPGDPGARALLNSAKVT